MIKKRGQPAILIEANIEVRKPDEPGCKNFGGIKRDMRPSIFVNGFHYISLVEECDRVIALGASGKATLLTATEALLETDVTAGASVELKSGPTTVAIAEILSMKRVFVKRDPSSERGYTIEDLPPGQ